ncbi:AAA family ATPase [Tuwongella immobilis]|uniref:Calcineurin-like phosphoesterase domain-containing protein n=1 Tax=Tuwongella immobilis TaxID=692036 RepID=A0A6C2YRU2_9BACT|nr:AAA family ATPase [Tuwongella immobilis]VIP04064.1 metallophosphoesterase : Metallophosphoesterase OS=Myxococcus fulvus (strain ATCC BAA-855 / HW-1) GN=LILAB_12425 PE=4 SV=1: AAA_33: Metallophos [Tuwongella immobilis]VTS05495.1 metallophosphoesterase : Metallophosphoesterase OS=Myxococcus fulvus (strain ATCC BAA-855 / HW-1) GN=LILAB_12425 PE=4 SV=1: AAA_33: Metallophos [Tuwongella immobilis]
MRLAIPELALVLLVGPSGAGKSTFSRKHFRPTEILSSDFFRAIVCDDETNQSAGRDAFDVLHLVASKRLGRGRLTVIDATNVQTEARRPLIAMARRFHVQSAAIVFDLPESDFLAHNRMRPGRQVEPHIIQHQMRQMQSAINRLPEEGFSVIHTLRTVDEVNQAFLVRERLPVNRRHDFGPFDIIGDIHGCLDELRQLLEKLGYAPHETTDDDGRPVWAVTPPTDRKLIFLGDLVDRGPDSVGVLRLVMRAVREGAALCVAGNHDHKLLRALRGRVSNFSHGLAETLEQVRGEPDGFIERIDLFLADLPSHLMLDRGRLVVAHAGLKQGLQGRVSDRVRDFALYGETTGDMDESGLPVRINWAAGYRGRAAVIYGHTPVVTPTWQNETLCIDTGCVYGGSLTALRYPERELVDVPAAKMYKPPKRAFADGIPGVLPPPPDADHPHD